ncbi:MAG TPA: di-heme oxidoredictase family protein [Methylocystis sp.]|nr:di-heme oxidoredictase family protein [Methylocystis sp.]
MLTGAAVLAASSCAALAESATLAADPGPRGGAAAAGGPIGGLTSDELTFFTAGSANFQEAEGIGNGLGPRFNLDRCSGCHAQPAVGGSSPAVNPQPAVGTAYGAKNVVPSFITSSGPVVEARFKRRSNGLPDGGVHSLFVIAGRKDGTGDASDCTAVQEDFDGQFAKGNVSLRIPTPVFGSGLIDSIDDDTILRNLATDVAAKAQLGILGHPNFSANAGTVTRFGWKAQNQSLLMFAGEAYNVEIGISNELFPIERDNNPSCQYASVPNDSTNVDGFQKLTAAQIVSDLERFSFFMKFLAPPVPSTTAPGGSDSITRGRKAFVSVGCALCHTPTLQTAPSNTVPALSNLKANLFSDLALHRMGAQLADDIAQGAAAGDEFRTAPLWGLGQRLFFLHDGRTSDLRQAIGAHASPGTSAYAPSEANQVIQGFNALPEATKQDLLNFLRSL